MIYTNKEKKELQSILDGLDFIIYSIDEDFLIHRINRTALGFLKKSSSEVLKKKCHEIFFNNKLPCQFCTKNKTGKSFEELYKNNFRNVQEIIVEVPAKPIAKNQFFEHKQYIIQGKNQQLFLVEILKDITLIKEKEEELKLNEKLISLGTIVQTVAHELRNPLTGIHLTLESIENNNYLFSNEKIDLIRKDLEMASSIVMELQSFVNRGNYRFSNVNIKKIINEAICQVKRIYHNLSFQIKWDWNIEDNLLIKGNEKKLIQVFSNILKNSIEIFIERKIISQADRPTIWIASNFVQKKDSFYEQNIEAIEIQIIDNAGGISDSVVKRIFDPFYTTKKLTSGTGLGMFIVHKILEEHKASIEVESKGHYSRVRINFIKLNNGKTK